MAEKCITDCEREQCLRDLPQMAGQTLYRRICDVPAAKIDTEVMRQLETLRGEPFIYLNIHDIPCNEISSDAVREIEPLVSVVVITYNHEKYISDTIDGILSQKIDFPFEIVIGEDCSTDRTREIVLEYQKKYPHLIRVMISKKNLYRSNSSNLKRTLFATRGRYIAFCEGDDYWIDEKKLQKQVEIFQKYERVNAVYTAGYHYYQNSGRLEYHSIYRLEGEVDIDGDLYGFLTKRIFQQHRTCSSIFRRELFEKRYSVDALDNIRLFLGDRQLWVCAALFGTLYYLNEPTAVYRIHASGATHNNKTTNSVFRDVKIINLFYLIQNGHETLYSKALFPIIADLHHDKINILFFNKPYFVKLIMLCYTSLSIMFNASIPISSRFYIALSIQKQTWHKVWDRLIGDKISSFCFYIKSRKGSNYYRNDVRFF